MSVPKLSLRNIRTAAGVVTEDSTPQAACMQLVKLGLEQYRREKERTELVRRLEIVDTRLAQIRSEKGRLIMDLKSECDVSPVPAVPPGAPDGAGAGFRIKY